MSRRDALVLEAIRSFPKEEWVKTLEVYDRVRELHPVRALFFSFGGLWLSLNSLESMGLIVNNKAEREVQTTS